LIDSRGRSFGALALGARGLALPPGAGDGAAGVIAAEGVVADGLAAGVCDGGVLRLALAPAAGVEVGGVTAAEGIVAAGVCKAGVAGLVVSAGAGVPGVIAADGVVGVAGLAAGPCNGAVAGFELPGAADGVAGVIAAEGVAGVTDVPVADVPVCDGRGCPFIPGSGWPAVATHAQTHNRAQKLSDLRPHLLDEIKEFFVTYNKLRDRKFRATHEASPKKNAQAHRRGDEELQQKTAQGRLRRARRALRPESLVLRPGPPA